MTLGSKTLQPSFISFQVPSLHSLMFSEVTTWRAKNGVLWNLLALEHLQRELEGERAGHRRALERDCRRAHRRVRWCRIGDRAYRQHRHARGVGAVGAVRRELLHPGRLLLLPGRPAAAGADDGVDVAPFVRRHELGDDLLDDCERPHPVHFANDLHLGIFADHVAKAAVAIGVDGRAGHAGDQKHVPLMVQLLGDPISPGDASLY